MTRALWLAVVAYAAASLAHFVHNAEFVADYPNLPAWISRGTVYAVWCAITAVGIAGVVLAKRGRGAAGPVTLAIYAALGLAGLDHYVVASPMVHTAAMNGTIIVETITAAALLLAAIVHARPALSREEA